MEGGFFDDLRQLEFFPGAEKQTHSCVPVASGVAQLTASDPIPQGIYQDEESVDLSALLESCNSDHTTSRTTSVVTPTIITATVSSEDTAYLNIATFQNYISSNSLPQPTMYGSDSYTTHIHRDINPTSPSPMVIDHHVTAPSSQHHVVQIDSVPVGGYVTNNAANSPRSSSSSKSPKSKSSKKFIDRKSEDYRSKRDRNNVAVRKSREKSRVRVVDTEKRVKELEEENGKLQTKIALLTKELHVLKGLFTSAGVSQPPSFTTQDNGVARK